MQQPVNLAQSIARLDEVYSPRIVGHYNDDKLMVVKLKGEFVLLIEPRGTSNTGDSGVEPAPELEL